MEVIAQNQFYHAVLDGDTVIIEFIYAPLYGDYAPSGMTVLVKDLLLLRVHSVWCNVDPAMCDILIETQNYLVHYISVGGVENGYK